MSKLARIWSGRPRQRDPSLDESDSGGALVEFTIIMPLFLLIVFGIIEWGLIFFLQNNMTNAAREAARTWAVQNQSLTQAQVCALATGYLTGTQHTYQCTATDHCQLTGAARTPDVTVQLSLDAAAASVINFTGYFTGGTLVSRVTMRKETACP
jgi:Flp pilus assembly protein TadG